MATYKTPNVYVEEISTLPPSVAEVETAIPVFVGHTRFAEYNGVGLDYKAIKINSMMEYMERFGGRPPACIDKIEINPENKLEKVNQVKKYVLYDSVQMFFLNGGGSCYIVHVGDFQENDAQSRGDITKAKFLKGLKVAMQVDEITMLLFPDAINLENQGLYSIQQAALAQCNKLMDRFAIFDLYEGETKEEWLSGCAEFRNKIGINNLKYGAAYTPWIVADIDREITYQHIRGVLCRPNQKTEDPPLKLSDLTDNTGVIELIENLELVTNNVIKMASVSYSSLPQNSPLISHMPNVADKNAKTDIEVYIEARGGSSILDEYNKLSALLKIEMAKEDNADVEGKLTDILSYIVGLLSKVIMEWKPGNKIHEELAQYVDDRVTNFLHALELANPTLIGKVKATISNGTDDMKNIADLLAASEKAPAKGKEDTRSLLAQAAASAFAKVSDEEAKPEDLAKGSHNLFHELYHHIRAIQDASHIQKKILEDSLQKAFPLYGNIIATARDEVNSLPPSGIMAGIYSAVDKARGVWKAPANISISSVSKLTRPIDDDMQEDLNIDVNGGKSINAIRDFPGRGTLVWGARTLMGNDNEWRYVPVRRFFNMVEESIKKATYWAVFEPNDQNLWVKVKSTIDNYLNEKWKQGALAGPTPGQAFFVNVGLGVTMTSQDILEGRLIIEIGMAVVRPAEFIVLRFSHKMQES